MTVQQNATIPTTNRANLSLYKSNNIDLSFNYPSDWGTTKTKNGEKNKGEYIQFTDNKNLFSKDGDFGRGGVVSGIVLQTYEKTDITTLDKHRAQIIIYKDPDNEYWIEGFVQGKNREPVEPFYIKYFGGLDQKTVLDYKVNFSTLLSSLKFSK